MSGPKSGHVTVSDRQRLEAERRQRERQEEQELAELRQSQQKADAKASRLQEKQERRLKELEARAQQRREREARRADELARQAEATRQRELAQLQRARAALATALSQRSALQSEFPGIALPAEPVVSDDAPATVPAIRAACEAVSRLAFEYQVAVDRAVAAWQSKQLAVQSVAESQRHAARFHASALRTAKDIIAVLDTEPGSARSAQDRVRIGQRRKAAKDVVARTGQDQPWQAHLELSAASLSALDKVMDAEQDSSAQVAYLELTQRLSEDALLAQAAYAGAEREAEQARHLAETHARQREREMVAATIRDTLEDLGYEVSDIEETAFTRDGALYASRSDQPDHAVRMQLDAGGQVRIEPVRVVDQAETLGIADLQQQKIEDANFDRTWCGPGGLGKFLKTARSRGLDASVKAVHAPGSQPVTSVDESKVGERVRNARSPAKQRKGLKSRQLPQP